MRLFAISVLLLLTVQTGFAQFYYGIKGGASLVGMALDQPGISNEQYRLSYQAGFYGTQLVSKRVFSRIELLYANKGFQAETPSLPAGGSMESFMMHLHYFSLPVFAGYMPTEWLFLVLGPEINYRLASRARFGSESNDAGRFWNERFDLGIAAGMGYLINRRINIELRYVHGLREVAPDNFRQIDSQDPFIIDAKSQNRVFQLSLAYQLN
ncbi:MAG: porin family protein [Bacteroidota bacterium]